MSSWSCLVTRVFLLVSQIKTFKLLSEKSLFSLAGSLCLYLEMWSNSLFLQFSAASASKPEVGHVTDSPNSVPSNQLEAFKLVVWKIFTAIIRENHLLMKSCSHCWDSPMHIFASLSEHLKCLGKKFKRGQWLHLMHKILHLWARYLQLCHVPFLYWPEEEDFFSLSDERVVCHGVVIAAQNIA